MTQALVSILIPCYDAAPWLAATLESALSQTWPCCEIIFVDDGSRDDSLAIARTFTARGVTIVAQPNRGASAARNHGLRLARGDFIQFLDADDLLAPDKIAHQLSALALHPEHIASCRWARFQTDPGVAEFADDDLACDFSPVDFLVLHTRDARMMHPASWLVPRAVADRAGPWDERLSLNDDGEYFARVLLASAGIICAPNTRTYYRSGLSGSLSHRRSSHAFESLALSVESVAKHLRDAEDSPRVHRALAEYWQRLEYEIYPNEPKLCRFAAAQARAFGGASRPPKMGPAERLAARFIGWRLTRRLRGTFK